MAAIIRKFSTSDLEGLATLLIEDAQRRSTLDPALWRLDEALPDRIRTRLAEQLETANRAPMTILVAEEGGRIVGVTLSMLVPVPPIYDPGVTPGLLLDGCCTAPDASDGTAATLLAATEAALREAGATSFIASSTSGVPWQRVCEANGYEAVTLYLAKHGFGRVSVSDVRVARADDVAGIVTLSAEHRSTLQAINDRFWHTHPDADARFGAWMGYSLTLADRSMLVADGENGLEGYVIAQPCPAMHMPLGHDATGLGVIDDFYAKDFASVASVGGGPTSAHLLQAAEDVFAKRGYGAALVVCPADWHSKRALLEQHGYDVAKIWMLKA